MKRATTFLCLAMALVLSSCGEGRQTLSAELQAVTLNEGQTPDGGHHTKKQSKVITTQDDYASELATYTTTGPTVVDFAKGKVLLIDMGPRATGGFSTDIAVFDTADSFVVAEVVLIEPGIGCEVTQAVTNPYRFVFIPTLKEILVSETVMFHNC